MAEETKSTKPADEEIERTAEPTAGEEIQPEAEKEENDADAAKEEQPEKKGFFGKKKEKKDKKDEQIEELTDRLKRQMAEFDNFRKRTEKEKAAMFEVGAKSVIEKMLPVIDNLERAIAAAEKAQETGALVDGVRMTYKAMMEALSRRGLEEIPAQGVAFDPELHHAVAREEGEGEPGTILEVYQKGYRVKDKIVRYAMVKVLSE